MQSRLRSSRERTAVDQACLSHLHKHVREEMGGVDPCRGLDDIPGLIYFPEVSLA